VIHAPSICVLIVSGRSLLVYLKKEALAYDKTSKGLHLTCGDQSLTKPCGK